MRPERKRRPGQDRGAISNVDRQTDASKVPQHNETGAPRYVACHDEHGNILGSPLVVGDEIVCGCLHVFDDDACRIGTLALNDTAEIIATTTECRYCNAFEIEPCAPWTVAAISTLIRERLHDGGDAE